MSSLGTAGGQLRGSWGVARGGWGAQPAELGREAQGLGQFSCCALALRKCSWDSVAGRGLRHYPVPEFPNSSLLPARKPAGHALELPEPSLTLMTTPSCPPDLPLPLPQAARNQKELPTGTTAGPGSCARLSGSWLGHNPCPPPPPPQHHPTRRSSTGSCHLTAVTRDVSGSSACAGREEETSSST